MLQLAIWVVFPIALISICYVMLTANDSEVVDSGHELTLLVFIFISVDENVLVAEDYQMYVNSCRNTLKLNSTRSTSIFRAIEWRVFCAALLCKTASYFLVVSFQFNHPFFATSSDSYDSRLYTVSCYFRSLITLYGCVRRLSFSSNIILQKNLCFHFFLHLWEFCKFVPILNNCKNTKQQVNILSDFV